VLAETLNTAQSVKPQVLDNNAAYIVSSMMNLNVDSQTGFTGRVVSTFRVIIFSCYRETALTVLAHGFRDFG